MDDALRHLRTADPRLAPVIDRHGPPTWRRTRDPFHSLARAIVRKPALLIADEPTGNLDDEMAAEIIQVIRDIHAGGTTVVFATHQARLASALRQRMLVVEGGRIVKDEG